MNPANMDPTQLLQAQSHLWNHIFNYLNSMSLKCAIELGILDAIHHNHGGSPMTIPELVAALPITPSKAPCIDRLMRILTHSGFFERKQEGYFLTNPSRLLLKDEPMSVAPFLKAMLHPVLTKPCDSLSSWFLNKNKDSSTPFHNVHGMELWEYCGFDPKLSNLFNEAMASDCRFVSNIITDKCKGVFEGLGSIVDVGGGTGTLTKAIADAFPDLECTVFDLTHVVGGGQEGSKNLKYEEGNMFDAIPPSEGVLLKWILHDWSDEECVKILKRCKEAILMKNGKGGKVIIIDMVVMHKNKDEEDVETQLFFDMLMMVLVKGKERKEEEWAKLFYDAGFSGYKISPMLGLRSLIEVYP